ncbi:VirB2 family type IV secretion system major pilin TrwL [Bartonella sp. B41]
MKYLKTLQSKVNDKIAMASVTAATFVMTHPAYVQAQSLNKATAAMGTIKTEITKFVPIAATVILLCLAIGYAGRFIGKATFIRWAVGIIIAGSATEITTILFPGNG